MFESLADRIREDEQKEVNTTERIIRWALMLVITSGVLGGLFYGIRMME
jgi:hypothetical protein